MSLNQIVVSLWCIRLIAFNICHKISWHLMSNLQINCKLLYLFPTIWGDIIQLINNSICFMHLRRYCCSKYDETWDQRAHKIVKVKLVILLYKPNIGQIWQQNYQNLCSWQLILCTSLPKPIFRIVIQWFLCDLIGKMVFIYIAWTCWPP